MMKALVTGHSRGIGQAVAIHLLRQQIPVLGLSRHRLDASVAGLSQADFGLLTQSTVNLADSTALAHWLSQNTLDTFLADAGEVLLINNAGTLGPVGPLGRQDDEALTDLIALNIGAPLTLANTLARRFGGPLRIAHIASGAGRSPIPGWSLYGASKAALDHHARCVQADAAPRIRISSIAPGVIDTDMQACIRATAAEDFPLLERFLKLKASGQLSSPDEVAAGLIAYCLSDRFGSEAVTDLRQLPRP